MARTNLQRRSVLKLDRLKGVLFQALDQNGYKTGKAVADILGCSIATANNRLNQASQDWSVGEVLKVLKAVGADTVELTFVCGVDDNGKPCREVVKLL